MKLHFIKSPLILVLTLSLAATSCLKDKAFENGSIQSGSGGSGADTKVISLGITVSSASYQYTDYNGNAAAYPGVQFLQLSYALSDNDTTINLVPVELGGLSAATQDIHVTLTQDDGLVATYNDSTGSVFTNPGSNITIVDSVVTIPKGSRTGFLQVKFKSSDLLNGNFAYGFKIASIAESGYTISGNLSQGIIAIGPKNKYDGLYSLTILSTGWAAYGIADGPPSNTWPNNVSIITTGFSSVVINTTQLGPLVPAFTTGGAATGFGDTTPQFTFDANDNLISVINTTLPNSRNRTLQINPAVTDSRYDNASKTIYAAFLMNQSGRPTQYFYDTLTYVGPR